MLVAAASHDNMYILVQLFTRTKILKQCQKQFRSAKYYKYYKMNKYLIS